MTAKTVAIGVALVLVGCADRSYVVSGNADNVIIEARYSNPGPQATEHCAKYGKIAVLENVAPARWRLVGGSDIYVFKCQ